MREQYINSQNDKCWLNYKIIRNKKQKKNYFHTRSMNQIKVIVNYLFALTISIL